MLDLYAFGRICTPIQIKTSKDKKTLYTSFLLASHKRKQTTLIRCVAFNGLATLLHEYFTVGDRIILQGQLSKDDYKDRKYSFQLKIKNFQFVETRADHDKNKKAHSNIKETTKEE